MILTAFISALPTNNHLQKRMFMNPMMGYGGYGGYGGYRYGGFGGGFYGRPLFY